MRLFYLDLEMGIFWDYLLFFFYFKYIKKKTIKCASIFILFVHNFIVFNGIVLGFEFQSISS